jgi:hypothetical protein
VPLVCCVVFVGISWIASYAIARTNTVTKLVTLCSSSPRGLRPHGPTPLLLVAVLTAFILTAAVIGIDVAVLQD